VVCCCSNILTPILHQYSGIHHIPILTSLFTVNFVAEVYCALQAVLDVDVDENMSAGM